MPATRSTDKSLWGHASTPVFYHPVQHADHQFISIQKIPVFVAQSGRVPHSAFAPFTDDDFAIAHDPGFVQGVFSMRLSNGFGTRDESVNNALRYSSASLWAATDHVLGPEVSGPRRIACSATQGFHHSGYDFAGGYCTFNGLVIAARKAMRQYPDIGRVLIIDGDGHYGNGTDDIIRRGNLTTIINITRPDIGPGGDGGPHSSFTATDWLEWTADLITTHRPGLILFQSGGDAWSADPYGAGYLSREALHFRDAGVFTAAMTAGIPLVWNLAGGYADPMQRTIDIHLETLRTSDRILGGETLVTPRPALGSGEAVCVRLLQSRKGEDLLRTLTAEAADKDGWQILEGADEYVGDGLDHIAYWLRNEFARLVGGRLGASAPQMALVNLRKVARHVLRIDSGPVPQPDLTGLSVPVAR